MKGTRSLVLPGGMPTDMPHSPLRVPHKAVVLPHRTLQDARHAAPCIKAATLDMGTRSEKAAVIMPGLGRSSPDYQGLGDMLKESGYEVEICFVRAVDWLRNAAGMTDRNYWKGTLNPRPTVDWYLKRIEEAVEVVKQKTCGAPITLIGHSAGGWLARLYMKEFGTFGIENLVTLGSPHKPPPKDKPGVFDQTRGILYFCEQEFPGNFHPDVNYITVAGKYVKGCKWNDNGSIKKKIAGTVYKQVCGEADVWGDGIVPNISSHLEGALNIELTDVFHDPITELTRNKETDESSGGKESVWYGSKGIAEQWLSQLDEAEFEEEESEQGS